jgi:excisionase family DNA binding protein
MKTVFTTGEAAEICKVSQQTIIRCFDSGRLRGFRVPGSRFRRIPRDALIQFMKDNGIPPDALDNGKSKILVVDDDPEIVELFVDVLERDGRFEVKTANTGYDAGMIKLLKAGADEFVKKPFNIEKLIERVGELLGV